MGRVEKYNKLKHTSEEKYKQHMNSYALSTQDIVKYTCNDIIDDMVGCIICILNAYKIRLNTLINGYIINYTLSANFKQSFLAYFICFLFILNIV